MVTSSQQSPFLRWAGSKRKLIPVLSSYWNDKYLSYYEPFMGSAQLFFSIDNAQNYYISDRNEALVEVYERIRNCPYAVSSVLKEFTNNKKEYYRVRNLDPNKLGKNQRAARFLYLNWLCFNGLYRTNLNGQFNVPYSGDIKKKLDNWPLLKQASNKLQKATIKHGDFEVVVKQTLRKDEFVYLDPPYALENQRIFTQYCNHTFGLKDIERLLALTNFINQKGAYFLLSYANTERIKDMFKSWSIREVLVQRNIAGFSRYRRKSGELLITNIK